MADYDQRPRGGRGGYNNRKRRYRGKSNSTNSQNFQPEHEADNTPLDEEDYDRRPQRRRYEEPLAVKVRKQLLSIAESPLKRVEDEVLSIAKTVCDNFEDVNLWESFYELTLQLVVEQPFKIPFVAAVVLIANTMRGDIVEEILGRAAGKTNAAIGRGEWREVKLYMKFLGSLQGCLDGEGVFPVLQDLLTKAVDLQTENNEEVGCVRGFWGCRELTFY
jgi:nuclear cap-binding protein subunit 1